MATPPIQFEVPFVTLHELRESVAELGFRPSYDLLWDQLTSELVGGVKTIRDGTSDPVDKQILSVVMPMWRLLEHMKEENQVLRRAVYRVLLQTSDVQETQHMNRRKKYESLRQRALANAANTAAAVAVSSQPLPGQHL